MSAQDEIQKFLKKDLATIFELALCTYQYSPHQAVDLDFFLENLASNLPPMLFLDQDIIGYFLDNIEKIQEKI